MKPIALFFILILLFISLVCSTSQAVREIIVTPSTVSSTLSPSASVTQQPAKTICAEHLNFRKTPGIQAPIFAVLQKGQQVNLTGQRETTPDGAVWVQAQTTDGTGWLNVNYLCER